MKFVFSRLLGAYGEDGSQTLVGDAWGKGEGEHTQDAVLEVLIGY